MAEKRVELVNGKQLLGDLKLFKNEFRGTTTIRIEGTVIPITNISASDFKGIDLFELKTPNSISMMQGIALPSYKILRPDLWCKALRLEIIEKLESYRPSYPDLESSRMLLKSIPFVVKRLKKEGKLRELSLLENAKLIGELRIKTFGLDNSLAIVGDVVYEDKKQSEVELLVLNNIFRIWSPFIDVTTKIRRINRKLWNKPLVNLTIQFLMEISEFTSFEKDIEKAVSYLKKNSNKGRFINQFHQMLIKVDDNVLQKTEVIEAFQVVISACGSEIDTNLLSEI
ncbi:MAG: hypothetical protein ABIE43_01575 [Patescibacteria group bacterium]